MLTGGPSYAKCFLQVSELQADFCTGDFRLREWVGALQYHASKFLVLRSTIVRILMGQGVAPRRKNDFYSELQIMSCCYCCCCCCLWL